MEPVSLQGLPENALLLVDSAPIIYVLEDHPELAPAFNPVFEAHEKGLVRFAVTTVTLAEVLTGPYYPVATSRGNHGARVTETSGSLE